MNEKIKVAAFIPLRGGSKSIHLKNIKPIAGKPLAYWSIEAALNSSIVDKIFVSTNSEEIRKCISFIKSDKLEIISRSSKTATEVASSESALIEFCENYEFEYVVFLQATSPLTTADDINEAWQRFQEKGYDSLITVARQKRFVWYVDDQGIALEPNYDPFNRPRRQDYEGYFVENGAFYISSREDILKSKNRISGNIGVYEMAEETYFEIDEPSDWIILENLLKERERKNINPKIANIKMLAMDVDGVLTDTSIYYGNDGNETKRFNAKDGKGIELLREKGFMTAIITSEASRMVENRAKKLKIDFLYMKIDNKKSVLQEISNNTGLSLSEIAYIGDDVNCLSAFEVAGFTACPADAVDQIKQVSDIILTKNGGYGAVREFCDLLLQHTEK